MAAKGAASVGFEYAVRPDQTWAPGLGWVRPASGEAKALRDEYAIETSYKIQLLQRFPLMPTVLPLIDPANNPDKDSVWIIGVSGILNL